MSRGKGNASRFASFSVDDEDILFQSMKCNAGKIIEALAEEEEEAETEIKSVKKGKAEASAAPKVKLLTLHPDDDDEVIIEGFVASQPVAATGTKKRGRQAASAKPEARKKARTTETDADFTMEHTDEVRAASPSYVDTQYGDLLRLASMTGEEILAAAGEATSGRSGGRKGKAKSNPLAPFVAQTSVFGAAPSEVLVAAANSRRELEQKLSQSLQDAAQVKAGDAAAVAKFSGSPVKTKGSGRIAMLILKSAQGKDRKDVKIRIQADRELMPVFDSFSSTHNIPTSKFKLRYEGRPVRPTDTVMGIVDMSEFEPDEEISCIFDVIEQ